ncbi:mechanosensitive ion channel family protein [Shivajiella indica]|uniref:Mechanosensitive ion channel family protein n=1 Tax=Shivajiella indica TaxID=872115 RepID=A0ABW5B946_9BACT
MEFSEEQAAPLTERVTLEDNIKKAQDFTSQLNGINQVVNDALDTTELERILPNAERFITIVGDRLENQEVKMNLRYINALENWLESIKLNTTNGEKQISNRVDQLFAVRMKLDSIMQHSLMRVNLRDTTLLPEYQRTISSLKNNVNKTDSVLNHQRLEAANYQSRTFNILVKINEIEERMHVQKRALEKALFQKETNFIWEPRDFPKTERLIFIFSDSFKFNVSIIRNYINRHIGLTIFLLVVVLGLYYWIASNLKKIRSQKEFASLILGRLRYIHNYPLLASLLVVLAIAPFFYTNPPISFFALILIILVSITGIFIKTRIGKNSFKIWLLLYFIFLISLASNLYWEVAYQERWHLLFLNLFGIYVGWKILKLRQIEEEDLPPYIKILARIYIFSCSLSLFANILGRFSLAKMIGVTGTLSLMHAISLIVFIIIIKEIIYVLIEVSRKNEAEFTSVIDFYDIQKRITSLFSYLAIAIWGYYFLESLGILESVLSEIGAFLTAQRNILNATFTFAQIAVFVLIIYIATFLANTISYIASIKDEQNTTAIRNKKLGSSILLIRLSILIVGFLIAIAASGIPLDKIAIVLGALSVGIGFGLQTIVNNLVSGIILAFEKPVQIGDTVQVGTIEGIVKDIGIRASKIKNWDGAEVIIPNGDLLAQHLTNWTLSDKQRRVELIIGVSYNADMDLVTKLIQDELKAEGILNAPPSRVFLQGFADNSVNFRVLFWVEDIDVWVSIRDQVMRGIFKAFKENQVEIPFPQRDLHIKSFPGLVAEKLFKPGEELK